jgi:L-threonylcarbamoyladenylate synthase
VIATVDRDALLALERSGVVAAPTETFFGLLADATRQEAIDRLFCIKPRGHEKGVPLLLPDRATWRTLVRELPPTAERLAEAFWPGPLTIALPAAPELDPRLLVDGRVAVRLPADSLAARLAQARGCPLTATSANRTGEPPATAAEQVRAAFGLELGRSELFLAGERAPGGAPSTVVVVDNDRWRLVRAGAVSVERIESALRGAG